jgi:hypothetical protein
VEEMNWVVFPTGVTWSRSIFPTVFKNNKRMVILLVYRLKGHGSEE